MRVVTRRNHSQPTACAEGGVPIAIHATSAKFVSQRSPRNH